jgi:hypothetical protein
MIGASQIVDPPTDPKAGRGIVDAGTLPALGRGLSLLLDSCDRARMLNEDPWEFAVEWSELQRVGLNCNDGRWLIHAGLVRSAEEATLLEDRRRRFLPSQNLSLSERTCLVLTEEGRRLAGQVAASCGCHFAHASARPVAIHLAAIGQWNDVEAAARRSPAWDGDRRQLRVGSHVVKEFKVPAMNQETVLAVFEEERWPPRIDDPLPWKSDIDPQRRLHDTVNSLNRRQRNRLVHFSADGLAQGIRWELVE